MPNYRPFGAEEDALAAAEHVLAEAGDTVPEAALAALVDRYRRLLRDARRLVRISDRREALLNELNKTLAAQQDELVEARDAAQAADRAKSAFLAAMSHEIRTPMNGVLGMVELLGESPLAADQREMLTTVQNSAQALLHIINDILDFSKIEAGRMELESVPLALGELVEDVAEMLGTTARARNLQLFAHVDPALPARVIGDPLRLRQVLYNLAGNAVKFTSTTPERQGVVRIAVAPARPAADGAALVQLAVEDNGIGIDAATQARLFQPFAQADAGTTRRFGGTGLGLAIVRRLVDLMGGQVTLTSQPDIGSTFAARVPLAPAPGEVPRRPLTGMTVAVLGDDRETDETVPAYLAADGATVRRRIEPDVDLVVIGPEAASPTDAPAGLRLDRSRGPAVPGRVNASPLRRAGLVRAVLEATGRMSEPETGPAVASRPAPGSGAAVLVADDDATNRNVLGRQLRRLGYAPETVPDGRAALQALQDRDYALLLTDCNMPELDGYALARALRQEGATLPILAVTADVTDEVIARCGEAGMDQVLLKPLSMATLRQAIEAHLAGTVAPPATPLVDRPADAALLDPMALDELADDDIAVRREILREFVDAARPIVDEVTRAGTAADAAAVGAAAHKLKSAAASVGAMALSDIARDLEQAGKAGDMATITQQLDGFAHTAEQTWQAIAVV